jgi:chemotaxis family two-component system sensor histidine kinase/response regulator PixL
MSLSPEIRDQAYQFFVEEAQELLQTIETGLLDLRHDRSTAKIHAIMRAAHSLKGGAASVELESIKVIAHRLETIFKALYDDRVVLDPTLESALLQGYDCLRLPLETQIDTGVLDHGQVLNQVDPILSHLETLLGDSLHEAESYMPTSQDLGVDIVASIFEVDVAQGLERWATVLESPGAYPVAGELRAQLEVFMGLSEILELPGFGELTQTSLQALDRHPDRQVEILALALEDFQQARHQVLQGDRQQGGSPSPQLVALAQGGENLGLEEDPQLGDIPSLADVFGVDDSGLDDFGADSVGVGSFGVEISLRESSLGAIPSLEDVFGTDPSVDDSLDEGDLGHRSSPHGLQPSSSGDMDLGEIPSLEDIFGDPEFEEDLEIRSPDRQSVEETIVQAQANFDQLPPLMPQSDPSLIALCGDGNSPSALVTPPPPEPPPSKLPRRDDRCGLISSA